VVVWLADLWLEASVLLFVEAELFDGLVSVFVVATEASRLVAVLLELLTLLDRLLVVAVVFLRLALVVLTLSCRLLLFP
jgi:hypothetical protein